MESEKSGTENGQKFKNSRSILFTCFVTFYSTLNVNVLICDGTHSRSAVSL